MSGARLTAMLARASSSAAAARAGGADLVNRSGSSGRLGLSSSNRSGVGRRFQVIEEDEYIAEVAGSVAFATTQYSINPGQAVTFPWGSKIASLYEKYEFLSLEFYYRREVSEYAANGQTGKIMLSVDQDASDAAPVSKLQVLDTVPHVDGMPCSETVRLPVDCAELRRSDGLYVRPGVQPPGTDIKTYDCGNLFVSTYGCANTSVIGELRVRYRVRVFLPVLEAAGNGSGGPGSYMLITSNLSGETAPATTTFGIQLVPATNPVIVANTIGATQAGSGLITLLPGTYTVSWSRMLTDTAATVTAGGLYVNRTALTNNSTAVNTDDIGNPTPTNLPSGYQGWYNGSGSPIVWNTALLGTTLCLCGSATYASGIAMAQCTLQITLL